MLTPCIKCHNITMLQNELIFDGVCPYHVLVMYYYLCNKLFKEKLLKQLEHVIILTTKEDALISICPMSKIDLSLSIDASFNNLKTIETDCFLGGYFLKVIKLNDNNIYQIKIRAFFNLRNLVILNLANNKLVLLSSRIIINTFNLRILNIA